MTSRDFLANYKCPFGFRQGFIFAHSSDGIQTMVLELPLAENDPQTIFVQYVLFSPLARCFDVDYDWDELARMPSMVIRPCSF